MQEMVLQVPGPCVRLSFGGLQAMSAHKRQHASPHTCVVLAKTSLLAIIVLLASCCSPSRFPLAIVVIITIAMGHHRHRIAIAIVATMLSSYQLHHDSLIQSYYCTIVLSYEVMPRACPRHA